MKGTKRDTIKKRLQRLTTPVEELDLERLRQFCAAQPDIVPIGELGPRDQGAVVGEIHSLRIVPRAGSPSLEATVTDGSGSLLAVWTGRRRIAGVAPGHRIILKGRGAPTGPHGRLTMLNPEYDLL